MILSSIQAPILVHQFLEKPEIVKSEEAVVTRTPLACLNEATGGDYGLIVVSFSTRPVSARDETIELCKYLKNNSLATRTPLVVSMEAPHRGIAVALKNSGVGLLEVRSTEAPVDPELLKGLIHSGDASISIDRVLTRMCPFLNYNPVDGQRELITCRAYGNRMVLGGRRLHEVCETRDYSHCDTFLHPRGGS